MNVSMKSGNKIYSVAATLLLLVAMLCLGTVEAEAQEIMQINFKVKFINTARKKEFNAPVYYKLYSCKSTADEVKAEYEKIIAQSDYDNMVKFTEKHGISKRTISGIFSGINAVPGMGMLVLSEEYGVAETFEIKEGVTDYPDVIFKVLIQE